MKEGEVYTSNGRELKLQFNTEKKRDERKTEVSLQRKKEPWDMSENNEDRTGGS